VDRCLLAVASAVLGRAHSPHVGITRHRAR
jgi:hypothetical protein